jgi:C4-dicarboxylate-specific signal transduction histidine kinase
MTDQLQNSFAEDDFLFQAIVKESVDGILIIDTDGVVRYANPAAVSMFSGNTTELIGFQIGYPASRRPVEMLLPNKDKSLHIEIQSCEINWNGQKVSLASLRNITERKRMENDLRDTLRWLKESQEQLVQVEKLGSLGTLTAGIAHELNNPMMGILNFVQYALKRTERDDKRYQVLMDAETEAKRCIGIVNNLLTFSRKSQQKKTHREKVYCDDILQRVLHLLSFRIEKEKVHIVNEIAGKRLHVWGDTDKIQQVFLNIIINALDALTANDRKVLHFTAFQEKQSVSMHITDSGMGIPPEKLSKIFDPFFTTKPVGKGTGLGLSVCRNIINDLGGSIACESRPGQGTRFSIVLPAGEVEP